MLTPQQGFANADYSGEHVSGEVISVEGGNGTLNILHTPIKPGTVVLTTPDDLSKSLVDIPNADGTTGTFTDTESTGLGAGTINYATGELSLSGITVSSVEVAYDYDLNSFDAPVDQVDIRVVSEPVIARPRKLKSVNLLIA